VKAFERVEIPQVLREQILDAAAMLLSASICTYRFFWVECRRERRPRRNSALDRCLRNGVGAGGCGGRTSGRWQRPRKPNAVDAQKRLQPRQSPRLRADGEDRPDPVHARTFGHFWRGQVAIFGLVNLWKTMGCHHVIRQDLLKWAMKSTTLACENLMIAAEALGLTTCPMEGLMAQTSRFLGLSTRYH